MPTTAPAATYDDVLAARYGLDRNPWPGRGVVGLVAIAFVGLLVWTAVGLARPRVEANLIRWQAEETGARVDMEVRGSATGPVRCVLRAQDAASVDIGYREFRIDRSPTTVSLDLPTLFRPASVAVLACAPEGEPLRVPPPDFPPGVAIP